MAKDYSYGAGSGLQGKTTELSGNTFPHREWLKELGARYDKNTKTWTLVNPSNNKACAALAYELRKRGIEF